MNISTLSRSDLGFLRLMTIKKSKKEKKAVVLSIMLIDKASYGDLQALF